MKPKPLNLKQWEVLAILDGRCTQIRRAVKPQPDKVHDGEPYWFVGGYRAWRWRGVKDVLRMGGNELRSPFGSPGDAVYGREAWRTALGLDERSPSMIARESLDANYRHPWCPIMYSADGKKDNADPLTMDAFGSHWGRRRSPSHMPAWASRIAINVKSVWVQRAQEISEADALACGFQITATEWNLDCDSPHPRSDYAIQFNLDHGPGAWERNPWVWVADFDDASKGGT